jgi:hypothetical protein
VKASAIRIASSLASAKVPWFARFYHGTFHVTFIGTDASGDQAQMEADVTI